jgi:hypothetical protein
MVSRIPQASKFSKSKIHRLFGNPGRREIQGTRRRGFPTIKSESGNLPDVSRAQAVPFAR